LQCQACDGLDLSGHDVTTQWPKLQRTTISRRVLLFCNAAGCGEQGGKDHDHRAGCRRGRFAFLKAKVLYAVQQPFQKTLLSGKTTQATWRSKPSYYAVSTDDRTINPDLQRFMAKRMGAKTVEVKSTPSGADLPSRDREADPGGCGTGMMRTAQPA
jgi:hypothetical protein